MSSKDKNYRAKRANLNELIYQLDENSNMYLTFKNKLFHSSKKLFKNENKESKISILNEQSKEKDTKLLIPEFSPEADEVYFDDNYNNNDSESSEFIEKDFTQEEKNLIFSKLKTKKGFFKNKKKLIKSNSMILPKIHEFQKDNENLFVQAKKLFNIARMQRIRNKNFKKLDLINLFSFERSSWNHENNKNKDMTERKKNRVKLAQEREESLKRKKNYRSLEASLLKCNGIKKEGVEKEVKENSTEQIKILKKPKCPTKKEVFERISSELRGLEDLRKEYEDYKKIPPRKRGLSYGLKKISSKII